MARQLKVLSIQTDNLNLIPRAYGRRRELSLQSCPLASVERRVACLFLTAQPLNIHTEIMLFKTLLGQSLKCIAS